MRIKTMPNNIIIQLKLMVTDFSKKIKERKWTKKEKEKSPFEKRKMVTQFSEPSVFQSFQYVIKKTLSRPSQFLESAMKRLFSGWSWLDLSNTISVSNDVLVSST